MMAITRPLIPVGTIITGVVATGCAIMNRLIMTTDIIIPDPIIGLIISRDTGAIITHGVIRTFVTGIDMMVGAIMGIAAVAIAIMDGGIAGTDGGATRAIDVLTS